LTSNQLSEKISRKNSKARVSVEMPVGISDYFWVKKIKSSNFNQPEWITSGAILKLIP